MSKNRKIGIVIWLLGFALSAFLLFIIPSRFTSNVYVTFAFDCIAFFSTLALWLTLFRGTKTSTDIFYSSPAMTITSIYLIIQLLICIVVGLLSDVIPIKATLAINVLLMVIVWIIVFSTISSKDHAKRIDSRQKDHHVEL